MSSTMHVSPGPKGALPDLAKTQKLEERVRSAQESGDCPSIKECVGKTLSSTLAGAGIFIFCIAVPPVGLYCVGKGLYCGGKKLYHSAKEYVTEYHTHHKPPMDASQTH